MIFGIGIDLVDTPRLQRMLDRHGDRALARFFTDDECSYCQSMPSPMIHFAARLAAKESFVKALGTGFTMGASWREIEVFQDERGRPLLRLSGTTDRLLRERCGTNSRLHLSISHTDTAATAIALIEYFPGETGAH